MKIPCVIVRGGTSKGIFVREIDLPATEPERTQIIAQLFGSPNVRQVDGLGGGDPLTSKIGVLSRVQESDEIGYLSGEVRLGDLEVNYGIMCGNLASGVFQAAYLLGLASKPADNRAKILNLNNKTPIIAVYDDIGKALSGKQVTVKLVFNSPGGAKTGRLLPMGEPETEIVLEENKHICTVVDSGAIYCFVSAADFGLIGNEHPEQLDLLFDFRTSIEALRNRVAEMINLKSRKGNISSGQVKVAILSEGNGEQSHIQGRIINPACTHKAYAVSGAIATCTAVNIKGTFANKMVKKSNRNNILIQHPEGVLEVEIKSVLDGEELCIENATIYRQSRLLMSGEAYLPF